MIDLQLKIRDAKTKNPLSNARVALYFDGNLVDNTTKVDSNGTITMKVHKNGNYTGQVTKAGYDDNNFALEVVCSKDDCLVKRFILMIFEYFHAKQILFCIDFLLLFEDCFMYSAINLYPIYSRRADYTHVVPVGGNT